MSAEVYVRVPDDADIDAWLCPRHDRCLPEYQVLAAPEDTPDAMIPAPISDLLDTAAEAGFEWEWEPVRRLLSEGGSDLQVNYGLHEWFSTLAARLRSAGWGYRFESSGKFEIPGECWEWMPGWHAGRTFVQSGGATALDADGFHTALVEAKELGVDPIEHLTAWFAPWPGWDHSADSA